MQIIRRFLTGMVAWLLCLQSSSAQQVRVTVNIVPPYSPYFSDYTLRDAGKVFIILQNTTAQTLQLKLAGQVQGDNGVKATTKQGVMPLQSITLGPLQTKQMNGTILSSVFDVNNFDITGIDRNTIVRTQRLPEGNYDICIQALDYTSNRVLSEGAPIGCTQISVVYPDAPVPINPVPGGSVFAATPQTIVFNWMNPGFVPPGTQYTLQLAEMPQLNSDPNQVLNAASFPLLSQTVMTTSYVYNVGNLALQAGKKYAWRVIANDPAGRVVFKNNGVGAAAVFSYGSVSPPDVPLTAVVSVKKKLQLLVPNTTVNYEEVSTTSKLMFAWNFISPGSSTNMPISDSEFNKLGVAKYKLTIAPAHDADERDTAFDAAFSYTTIIDKADSSYSWSATGNDTVITGSQRLNSSIFKNVQQCDSIGFKDQYWYRVSVAALDGSGHQVDAATPVDFQYLKKADPKKVYVLVKGNLQYKFDPQPATYGIPNTDIVIIAYKALSAGLKINPKDPKNYKPIAAISATTDSLGNIAVQMPLSLTYQQDKICYAISIKNLYYQQPVFLSNGYMPGADSSTINIGNIVTDIYGYGLKVYVSKDYLPAKGITLKDSAAISKAESGIPVVLYRKNRNAYLPSNEGTVTNGIADRNGDVLIAEGTTQLETGKDGATKAFVQFDKLICHAYNHDEYYILAKNKPAAGTTNVNTGNNYGMMPQYMTAQSGSLTGVTAGAGFTPYEDSSFIASPMSFTLQRTYGKDSLYQSATANYTITAKSPATATIKGKVLFRWGSDAGKELRPVKNATVTIEVGYDVMKSSIGKNKNNQSSGTGKGTKNTATDNNGDANGTVTIPAGYTFPDDDNKIVGVGKTDAEGNFTIQMVTYTNQVDFPDMMGLSLKRTYHIEVANPYLSTTAQMKAAGGFTEPVFTADAFSTQDLGDITYLANEIDPVTVRVHPKNDPGKSLGNMKVIVFRNPADKSPNILPGEGDGTDTSGLLVNPYGTGNTMGVGFGSNANPYDSFNPGVNAQNFYTQPVEKIWSLTTPDDGTVVLKKMFNNDLWTDKYYIEVSGDPTQGQTIYGAFITSAGNVHAAYHWETNAAGNSIKVIDNPAVIDVYLPALPTRISGRLVDASNTAHPLKGGSIEFTNAAKKQFTHFEISDQQGYFDYEIGTDNDAGLSDNGKQTVINVRASQFGYDNNSYTTAPLTKTGMQSLAGGTGVVLMNPGSFAQGNIKDEAGNPVKAYIRRVSDSLVKDNFTDGNTGGYFKIPMPSTDNLFGGSQKLEIIPMDVGYFDTTLLIPNSKLLTGMASVGTVTVYRRKHRMHFVVTDENGLGIAGARIQLDASHWLTTYGSGGIADTSFEDVSDHFVYQAYGSDKPQYGLDYIPQTLDIKNTESKDYVTIPVQLSKGSIITGKVTLDGAPVANAKVYLDITVNQSGNATAYIPAFPGSTPGKNNASLVQTFTRSDGGYTLYGVPVNTGSVNVIATLDTSFAVNGDEGTVTIKNKSGSRNFALKSYKDMVINSVFGFPLSVENITTTDKPDEVLVTGLLDISKSASDFSLLPGNDKLRIRDVRFKSNVVNGKKVGEPVNSNILLEGIASLKFRYLNKYNVQVNYASPQNTGMMQVTELAVSKNASGKGTITGLAHIVDNSFNYPETYLNFKQKDNFYLATLNGGKVNPVIPAVTAVSIAEQVAGAAAPDSYGAGRGGTAAPFHNSNFTKYNLGDAQGNPIQFNFIEFKSSADPAKSYIDAQGKIHLNINMACNIPNAKPADFNVSINDVVLDDSSIHAAASNSPIEVQLEKWNLVVKDWTLDPQHGGIWSENAFIQTSKLNIPVDLFNLRHDMVVMNTSTNGMSKLKLGGIVDLSLAANKDHTASDVQLVYDSKVGSDMSPHWKFTVVGKSGNPAATIGGIAGFPSGTTFGIDYIQLLSNDENIFSVMQNGDAYPLYGNKYALFTPQGITNGADFFELYGTLNVPAPRFTPSNILMHYTSATGAPQIRDSSKFTFEGKGNVQFISDKPVGGASTMQIDATHVIIPGKVQELPNTTFSPLTAKFIADASNNATPFTVKVDPQSTPLGNPAKYNLDITQGSMDADKNDWGLLNFKGKLNDPKDTDPASSGISDNEMTFTVHGDVDVSGSQIKTSKQMAFGEFTMIFDYSVPSLYGQISVHPAISIGSASMEGDIETMFGAKGWYFAGGIQLTIPPAPIYGGTYFSGFFVGNYMLDDKLVKTVTQYSSTEIPHCRLVAGQQYKGFYTAVGKKLIDVQKDFNLVVVAGYVYARVGGELDLWADFSGLPAAGMQLGVYNEIGAGAWCPVGSLDGHLEGAAIFTMQYLNSKFFVSGEMDESFGIDVSIGDCPFCLSAHPHAAASLYINSLGDCDFSLSGSSHPPDHCH